jgi:hypothetical protein
MDMQKIAKCGIVGGFILFFWAALSFTLLPWQRHQMKSFTNERSVRSAIADNIDGSGLYILPNLNDYGNKPSQLEAAKERMREGPFIVTAVRADGKSPNMVGNAIASLIFKVVSAGLATWLLLRAYQPQHLDFTNTVKFMSLVGVLVGLSTTVPYLIWFGFPLSFSIGSFIEIIFGWLFAGMAIARMLVEPRRKHKNKA